MRAPVAGAVALVLAGACYRPETAGQLDASDASTTVAPEVVGRGEYLVRSVAGCGECHTPRDAEGNLVASEWLSGVANRFDLVPEDDTTGGISTGNLTPAGLSGWTDAEIESAFLDGVARDGSPLFPLMPYAAYHNMAASDADAIVAYLRSVPAVANVVPPRQPLPVPLLAPAPPIPEGSIPQTTLSPRDPDYAVARLGRYLAGEVGFCLDCHTPWRLGPSQPLDLTRVFAGGRAFSAKDWSLPPPLPAVVYSLNITPDEAGIAGYSAGDVAAALAQGITPGGTLLCRPMPAGPLGALGGLLAGDAYAIGVYLTTIDPVAGETVPSCP